MSDFKVHDSGQRQEFETGARRDIQEGKGRFDLIPPLPIRRLARIYEEGAKKYGDHNWKKGMPLSRYLDSCERHLNNLKSGEPTEDHAMQAVWNLFSYVWTLNEIEAGRLPRVLDDRPKPEPQYEKETKACGGWTGSGGVCTTCGVAAYDHGGAPTPEGRGCKQFVPPQFVPSLGTLGTKVVMPADAAVCAYCLLPKRDHKPSRDSYPFCPRHGRIGLGSVEIPGLACDCGGEK